MAVGWIVQVLEWPGTLAGQPVYELATWLNAWDPFAATVGLAACNAAINSPDNALMRDAEPIRCNAPANLAVFEYFRPRLKGLRTAIIGHYPGIDNVFRDLDVTVLERQPHGGDLPDPAAEFVLPQSDWVFITATSLINKTFHRLCELSRDAVTVLMGPSTPWLAQWSKFDVDYLAGVQITDIAKCEQIAAEGGGTRLFEGGVRYAVADISEHRLEQTQKEIQQIVARRNVLTTEMSGWYEAGNQKRYRGFYELEALNDRLYRLDMRYRRLWNARQNHSLR
ncbi:MAG: DUF364 domain-containing protein [Pseudomonadota bacterium]